MPLAAWSRSARIDWPVDKRRASHPLPAAPPEGSAQFVPLSPSGIPALRRPSNVRS
jgi:hypothetical protein